MKRINCLNKFYRRYEVDLWGKSGLKHNFKIINPLVIIVEIVKRIVFDTWCQIMTNSFAVHKLAGPVPCAEVITVNGLKARPFVRFRIKVGIVVDHIIYR